jgi:peptidoglycan/LPS O-acetylase OafA/YrhL
LDTPHRSNNFDLLRLLAAAQVVFVHAVGHTPVLPILSDGARKVFDVIVWFPGVAVFFVISGFLVARSYERLRGNLRAYFWHRALRIYPALLVCLAVSVVVLACFGFLGPEVRCSPTFWAWLLGQLTCGQFYNPEFFRGFGVGVVNGALWTISVELQFYLALPAFYALAWPRGRPRRFRRWLVPATFAASFCAFCYVDMHTNGSGGFRGAGTGVKLLFVSLVPHWWMFLLGLLLHRHFARLRGWLEGRLGWHFAAYLTFAALRHEWIGRDSPLFPLFYLGYLPERVLLATLTVAAAFSLRGLSNRLLGATDISYGIYLYHFLIINVLVELNWMRSPAAVAAVFVLAAAAGAAGWFGIERRALGLKHRLAPKPQPLAMPRAGEA